MRRLSFAHFCLLSLLTFSLAAIQAAQAQTFTVLHNFSGGADGAAPSAGVAMDAGGNLYGTTSAGGLGGGGTVFKLTHTGSGWELSPLHTFGGPPDGLTPEGGVIFGPDGSLYGTTTYGGDASCLAGGCGTVFKVSPSPTACKTALCPGTETVLYAFAGDGAFPRSEYLVFDQAGNIYGTTSGDTLGVQGTVFKLTPSSGGQWTESTLGSFPTGDLLESGVILDEAGNAFGTTRNGGAFNEGTVYELMPSGSGWIENTLYDFNPINGGGSTPLGGLIFDGSGNLYGATYAGGGTVYELRSDINNNWHFFLLYSFTGLYGSAASLTMDSAGNLYGTTYGDGAYQYGSVFKLTASGGGWTYSSLHDFTGGSDGSEPESNVTIDANGNLYGTTTGGGSYGYGVVWEITP